MSHRAVEFYSQGAVVRGEFLSPDAAGKHPALVFCHGFGGIRQMFLNDFARYFADAGYACLTFDYRGFGDSEGERGRLMPLEQVQDILNAVTFTAAQPEVDEDRIGLYGISFGGGNAVYAAGIDPRVRAAITVVGFGDGARWMRSIRRYWEWLEFLKAIEQDRIQRVLSGRSALLDPNEVLIRDPESLANEENLRKQYPERAQWKLTLEMAEAIVNFSPESVAHRISPRALLVIAAADDGLIPVEEALSVFEKAGEHKRLVMYEGLAHHDLYRVNVLPGVLRTVQSWLEERLAPSPQ
jgi:hypothetical protein